MKILMLCNKSPWPAKEGGPIAMFNLASGLHKAGHSVDIIAVSTPKYPAEEGSLDPAFETDYNFRSVKINTNITIIGALLNLISGKPYHVSRFYSPRFVSKLSDALQKNSYDLVQLEAVYMASYIDTIREHSDVPVVLRSHNIEHLIWQRVAAESRNPFKRWYIRLQTARLKRFELDSFTKVDGIAAISPCDCNYIEKYIKDKPVVVIPFGIDTEGLRPKGIEVEWPSLFHIGSMDWYPNLEGINWFLKNCWPLVNNEFPNIKMYLAGRNMPHDLLKLNAPNVIICGEVDDAYTFIESKGIMIVPLFSGSGIRIKIIEAMALGKPIVSTTIGAEGIGYTDGINILIADTPLDFVRRLRACILEPENARKIGINARELMEREHNLSVSTKRLSELYVKLARKS